MPPNSDGAEPRFDLVISLGAWCQVRHQLQKYHRSGRPWCFDWLVTPWASMMAILETDGRDFCTSLRVDDTLQGVVCERYGVLHMHDFPRDAAFRPIVTRELIASARNKMMHKYTKTHQALQTGGKRVLFVRFGGPALPVIAWPYLHDNNNFGNGDLDALAQLLAFKYPMLDFEILFLYYPVLSAFHFDDRVIDARCRVRALPPETLCNAWEGSDELWSQLMHEVENERESASLV